MTGQPDIALEEARRMWTLAAATLERDVLLHGMTADEQDVMIGAVLNAAIRLLENPPKHDFWGAGEKDCPREIRAGNGELHTLRCKVCGLDNPPDETCRAAIATIRSQTEPTEAMQEPTALCPHGCFSNSRGERVITKFRHIERDDGYPALDPYDVPCPLHGAMEQARLTEDGEKL